MKSTAVPAKDSPAVQRAPPAKKAFNIADMRQVLSFQNLIDAKTLTK
jgi:hypothetical protein